MIFKYEWDLWRSYGPTESLLTGLVYFSLCLWVVICVRHL